MSSRLTLLAVVLLAGAALAEDPRLAKFLEMHPKSDLNRDGVLTLEEARDYRSAGRSAGPQTKPQATGSAKRYSVDELVTRYEARDFQTLHYRFFAPHVQPGERYPLVLTLHGAGGKGDDNRKNLKPFNGILTEPEFQRRHPCFVVAPQTRDAWRVPGTVPDVVTADGQSPYAKAWNEFVGGRRTFSKKAPDAKLGLVFELLDDLSAGLPIDRDRVYVLGHSMGGFGTFEALAMQPKRFAAAIPSAGGLPPWHDPLTFQYVPIWAFHGDQDPTVPIEFTVDIFERLRAAGGKMKFTTLGGVGHGASEFAFDYNGDETRATFRTQCSSPKCDPTQNIWDWLFAQKRPNH